MMLNQANTPFVGMTPAQLQAALAQFQAAYTALSTGSQVATVSYAQGDGNKSVQYRRIPGDLATLSNNIAILATLLGLRRHARRAIPVTF